MTATTEAIHSARAATEALFDMHLPSWENPERRLDFIDRIEAIYNCLERALYASTTVRALACESEDGTALRDG